MKEVGNRKIINGKDQNQNKFFLLFKKMTKKVTVFSAQSMDSVMFCSLMRFCFIYTSTEIQIIFSATS